MQAAYQTGRVIAQVQHVNTGSGHFHITSDIKMCKKLPGTESLKKIGR